MSQKHNLRVVEDCAQAAGASIDGQKCGTFGDFGCYSFQGGKHMTTLGEGGILTVTSDEDAALVPKLRHNGCCRYESQGDRYWVPSMTNVDVAIDGVWPNNFCIGEAQCALGSEALKGLEKTLDCYQEQAKRFMAPLADTPEISFSKTPKGYRHAYYHVVMHFDGSAFGKDRDDLLDILTKDYKIRVIVVYQPLYRYALFQKLGAGQADCPSLEAWWDNTFCMPWWVNLPDDTMEYLTSSLKAAIAQLKGQ